MPKLKLTGQVARIYWGLIDPMGARLAALIGSRGLAVRLTEAAIAARARGFKSNFNAVVYGKWAVRADPTYIPAYLVWAEAYRCGGYLAWALQVYRRALQFADGEQRERIEAAIEELRKELS